MFLIINVDSLLKEASCASFPISSLATVQQLGVFAQKLRLPTEHGRTTLRNDTFAKCVTFLTTRWRRRQQFAASKTTQPFDRRT